MKIFHENSIIKEENNDDKLNNSFSEKITVTLKENLVKLISPKNKIQKKKKVLHKLRFHLSVII